MRGFVAFAVLCAAVAYAGYVPYPNSILEAWSDLNMPIGHFYAELQVPPEPKDQSNQKVVYFVSANMNYMFHGHATVRAGLVLMWDVENHWRAIAGGKSCDSTGSNCRLSWADDAALAAEPGDIVFLNVSGVAGQSIAYMEAELPLKNQTSGIAKTLPIPQSRVVGVFASVHASGVGSCMNTMPRYDTWMQRVSFTAAMNREKELPLNWNITKPGSCGEKFTHYATQLNIRWWDGKKH